MKTKINRALFNIYHYFFPDKATEWLNEKLETARIADEGMEWEPDLS